MSRRDLSPEELTSMAASEALSDAGLSAVRGRARSRSQRSRGIAQQSGVHPGADLAQARRVSTASA